MKITACLIIIFAHSNTNYSGNWHQGKFHFGLEPGVILAGRSIYQRPNLSDPCMKYEIYYQYLTYPLQSRTFFKKHDVLFIRDVIPLEEQYNLYRNKVYTAGAIKNTSLSKNSSDNFINFSKYI